MDRHGLQTKGLLTQGHSMPKTAAKCTLKLPQASHVSSSWAVDWQLRLQLRPPVVAAVLAHPPAVPLFSMAAAASAPQLLVPSVALCSSPLPSWPPRGALWTVGT